MKTADELWGALEEARQLRGVLVEMGCREDVACRTLEELGPAAQHPDVEVVLGITQCEHHRWVRA